MLSYWIRQARHTHSMNERQRKKQKTDRNEQERKKKVACPPVGDVADNTERGHGTIPSHINRVRLRTNRKNRQIEAQQNKNKNTLQAAAAVCGTISIYWFYLLRVVGLVPCYPHCRLLADFVNHAPPPARMRQTIRNKQRRLVIHPRNKDIFRRDRLLS